MSSTLKKLGIEYRELSHSQVEEASISIKQMRLESILIGECENFGLENLYNRPDLIGLKD